MNSQGNKINPRAYIFYILGACMLGGIVFFYEMHVNNEPLLQATANSSSTAALLSQVSQGQPVEPLSLLYASTSAEQELGLGNRASLPADEGMLFIFSTPGNYGFWMKDMNFSIDMIWMDENFVITHIAPDVSPDTYPASFYPNASSSYVLETNAGYSQENNLLVGETLDFVKNSLQNSQ